MRKTDISNESNDTSLEIVNEASSETPDPSSKSVSTNEKTEEPTDCVKPKQSLDEELTDLMVWLREGKEPLSNEQLDRIHIDIEDFKLALKSVQPSATREGFATVPDVTWDDIGSLKDIREKLQLTILVSIII